MKWSRVLLVLVLAALMFGGSFTCSYKDLHPSAPPQAR
jgi:hypothetical protein